MTHRYVANLAMWVRYYTQIEFNHDSSSAEVASRDTLTREFILENLPEVDNEDYSHSNPIGITISSVNSIDMVVDPYPEWDAELDVEDNVPDSWLTTFTAREVEAMIKIASGMPSDDSVLELKKRLDTFSVQIATDRIRRGL
jgi:hypothetical protein